MLLIDHKLQHDIGVLDIYYILHRVLLHDTLLFKTLLLYMFILLYIIL